VSSFPHRDRSSAALRLHAILEAEWARRRRLNPRYSLRAFARSVRIEHSTLSQLLRGKRPTTWKCIQKISGNLRWLGTSLATRHAQRGNTFDSRLLARELGVTVDEVNVALTDLCMFGLIELKGE
jgi:transcriptional regulator with XRE-family HTH domain